MMCCSVALLTASSYSSSTGSEAEEEWEKEEVKGQIGEEGALKKGGNKSNLYPFYSYWLFSSERLYR